MTVEPPVAALSNPTSRSAFALGAFECTLERGDLRCPVGACSGGEGVAQTDSTMAPRTVGIHFMFAPMA